jgi:hypothetical protein
VLAPLAMELALEVDAAMGVDAGMIAGLNDSREGIVPVCVCLGL